MNYYPEQIAESCGKALSALTPQAMSLRENLEMQKRQAESEVARLTELVSLLDAHPEVNRIMELLGRRGL